MFLSLTQFRQRWLKPAADARPKKWITAVEKVGKLTAGEQMRGEPAEHRLAL